MSKDLKEHRIEMFQLGGETAFSMMIGGMKETQKVAGDEKMPISDFVEILELSKKRWVEEFDKQR